MEGSLDIADLPGMLLNGVTPFDPRAYVPEWQFWLYVAEREGRPALRHAEACARFFLENYVGLDKYPAGYRRVAALYQKEWWVSIPRPKETNDSVWLLFDVLEEFLGLDALPSGIQVRRPGRNRILLTLRNTESDGPHIELERGRRQNVVHVRLYHPLTGRHYWPEWFFGRFGNGHVRIWASSEMEAKLGRLAAFCGDFLPIFGRCDRAKPLVPYDKVVDGDAA